jgi:hypothetical protein
VPVVEEPQPAPFESTTDAGAAANVESATANAPVTSTAVAKPTGPAKTTRAQSPKKTDPSVDLGSDRVIVEGDTVYIGNTKITDGRIETPNRVIDENGITPRTPGAQPPIPPPDLRHLTPEQRRRVLRRLRRNGVIVARPTP